MATSPRRSLILTGAGPISPSVRSLTFRTADGEPFGYVAGQWVNLYVTLEEEVIDRSYSIASAHDRARPDILEFAVTLVDGGPMSSALHALDLGAAIEMQGPFGFFTLDHAPPDAPIVFVGTGTGVTPLRAMIQEELRRAPSAGPPLSLLFGCRTPDDILYREELESLASTHDRFHYEVTLSRPEETWSGRAGYVQTHLGELCGDARTHVYICGLSKMVKEVRRVLKEEHGYDRKRIHTERYD